MNKKRPPEPFLTEGRRLFQRMLTLHVDGKHGDAAAEIFGVNDVRIIMTALNVAAAGFASVIVSGKPDLAERAAYLQEVMLNLEGLG